MTSAGGRAAEEGSGDEEKGGDAADQQREGACEGALGHVRGQCGAGERSDHARCRHGGGDADVEAASCGQVHGEPEKGRRGDDGQ